MTKIRTYNQISSKGLDRFDRAQYQVGADQQDADAIVLRSHKLSPDEIENSVRAIARAHGGEARVLPHEPTGLTMEIRLPKQPLSKGMTDGGRS